MGNQVKTIAISGLHRGENPQPGAPVIASIRRQFPNLRIIGLSYDPLESSLYSESTDHPDVAYLMPYPGIGAEALWERLEPIIKKENIEFIIPCLDSEIRNFIDITPKLCELGVQCMLPSKKSLEAISKPHLYDFCNQINVLSPRTKVAMDQTALEAYAEQIGYPVYVKGSYYEADMATTPKELNDASKNISYKWGWPLLVQEVVFGEEYDVVGLGDGHGGISETCTIRKFQRSIIGKGFAGIVIEDPELDEITKRIIKELKWNGPFELEFIKAPGKPHSLLEVNPRFPAWVDFPSQIGCNLPARLLEMLLDAKTTPLRKCTSGQMFIRHSLDLVCDVADLAEMSVNGELVIKPYNIRLRKINES